MFLSLLSISFCMLCSALYARVVHVHCTLCTLYTQKSEVWLYVDDAKLTFQLFLDRSQ